MMMNYTKGLVDQFRFLSLIATITTLVPYIFCAAAYVIIRFTGKKRLAGSGAAAVFIAVMAFAYSLWAIAGSGESSVFWGFLLMMSGLPFYVWVVYRKRNRHDLEPAAESAKEQIK
jgi:APA family basic amino acid/polyamine antiporter